jgi:hypothetical protein
MLHPLRLILLLLALVVVWPAQSWAEAKSEEAEEAKGPQFVSIGPLTVPVIRDGRIYQYVRITVKLEAKDGTDAEKITGMIPSLNDAYLTNLYGAFYVGKDMQGPLVDLDRIRERLSRANDRVLPAGLVQNILIQHVNQSNR